ncbi:hypothetical protein RND59_11325 [Vibrio ruber]|uniref:hypothetical protein n=1 Tax=Vibrio ruber TaxID=184755 RepID=UPI002892E517|nr:hypothetical protein [Vibrio ruber]WNJ94722.1 hypothetical protein RND59_11325 [Vibrio ruber]
MFDISSPYSAKEYMPFYWSVDEVAKMAFSAPRQVVSRHGFILASSSQLKVSDVQIVGDYQGTLDIQDAQIIEPSSSHLKRHDLHLLKVQTHHNDELSSDNSALYHYQKAIVLQQLYWIKQWSSILIEHTAQRVIGDKTLLSVSSVKLRLAEILQHHAWLSLTVDNLNGTLSLDMSEHLADEIDKLVDMLIKTAGGRALLHNGLVDMQYIFRLLSQIYLRKNHD